MNGSAKPGPLNKIHLKARHIQCFLILNLIY